MEISRWEIEQNQCCEIRGEGCQDVYAPSQWTNGCALALADLQFFLLVLVEVAVLVEVRHARCERANRDRPSLREHRVGTCRCKTIHKVNPDEN